MTLNAGACRLAVMGTADTAVSTDGFRTKGADGEKQQAGGCKQTPISVIGQGWDPASHGGKGGTHVARLAVNTAVYPENKKNAI